MSIVEIKNLTKKFGDNIAVDNVDLTIKEGEVFGLLGPNGAGKTTLIRVLIGLLQPTSGSAKVFNLDVVKDTLKIRMRTSLLPQECQVYENLTGRESIQYYGEMHGGNKEEIKKKTQELLELIGLADRADDLTKKYSGGMKRKVLVARTLVMDPDLIFLDEPTTAIDVLGARTVRNLIKKLSKDQNKTVILTTHDLAEVAELCDRVGIMVKGKLVAIGTPDELEVKFKAAHLEDVFIGLVTGEGIEEFV